MPFEEPSTPPRDPERVMFVGSVEQKERKPLLSKEWWGRINAISLLLGVFGLAFFGVYLLQQQPATPNMVKSVEGMWRHPDYAFLQEDLEKVVRDGKITKWEYSRISDLMMEEYRRKQRERRDETMLRLCREVDRDMEGCE